MHLNEDKSPPTPLVSLLLRIACFLLFLGQGWIHLFQDAPFRALLWNQELLEPWIDRFFNQSWEDYTATSDHAITAFIRGFGAFYMLCAVLSWTAHRDKKIQTFFLATGSLALAFLAFLKFLDHNHQFPQLIEHTAQWASPLLLIASFYSGSDETRIPPRTLEFATKIAVALTFTGHGLYAAGIYPVPGNFVWMTSESLGLSEPAAFTLLKIAGYLDFCVSIGIFLPRITAPCLLYATIWGALTSLARVVSHITPAEDHFGLHPWLAETIARAPHALLPAALFVACFGYRRKPQHLP